MTTNPIEIAVGIFGSQTAMADRLGVKQQTISNWIASWNKGDLNLDAKLCYRIEVDTGGAVTRQMLHPADWIAIWPELASASSFQVTA
ncbi:transcriptional regulator [Pandoraea communis]|nr:YdaS family helix-turn-helix protein [Pandoraea communis]